MANAAAEAAGPVVEQFASSVGRYLGYFGMAFGAVTAVAAAIDDPPSNWRVFLLGVGIAALSWLTLVRPSVALHRNGVLIRNMLRDSFVPASKIDRCRSAQTLMIRAGSSTFHGLGVSRSARSIMRERRGPRRSMFSQLQGMSGGFGAGGDEPTGPSTPFASQEVVGPDYQHYVEGRIEQAARDAADDDLRPVVAWAPLPVAGLAVAVLAVVALFL